VRVRESIVASPCEAKLLDYGVGSDLLVLFEAGVVVVLTTLTRIGEFTVAVMMLPMVPFRRRPRRGECAGREEDESRGY